MPVWARLKFAKMLSQWEIRASEGRKFRSSEAIFEKFRRYEDTIWISFTLDFAGDEPGEIFRVRFLEAVRK
jgi:hypothetical protein